MKSEDVLNRIDQVSAATTATLSFAKAAYLMNKNKIFNPFIKWFASNQNLLRGVENTNTVLARVSQLSKVASEKSCNSKD